MVNRFNWVEIRVRDLEKAKNFYGSLFDWKINGKENRDRAYWLIGTGEKPGGGIWRMPKEKSIGVVYILVDNIDETLEKVVSLKENCHSKNEGRRKLHGNNSIPQRNIFGIYQYGKERITRLKAGKSIEGYPIY